MALTLVAAAVIALIGGIAVSILLYYHQQTLVVWVTYATIMAALLPFFWTWHRLTVESPKQEEQQQALPPKNEPPASTPLPTPPNEQSNKVSQTSESEEYKPDEIDKMILHYLAQGIDPYLQSITKYLQEKSSVKLTSEVEYRLRRLVEHKYIRRIKPKLSTSKVYLDEYKLEQKGGDFLFSTAETPPKKPVAKAEPIEKQHSKRQPSKEYKLDKIAIEILKHIYEAEWPDPIEDLPNELSVSRLEIETRLDKLIEHYYVEVNEYNIFHGNSPYSLTPIGRECLANNARNKALDKTLAPLKSFRDNLSKHEMQVSDMDEYHSLLDTIQNELQCDLSEFRIPPSAIDSRTGLPKTFGYSIFEGEPPPIELPVEKYIPSEVFHGKLDALISHLEQKRS